MRKKEKKLLIRIIIAALLLALATIIPAKGILKLLLFLPPYIVVGHDIVIKAVRNIFSGQVFDENLLMTLATLGAFVIGEYPEAAAVMLFYQTGEFFQSLAVAKSRKSIAALMDIRPISATVIRNGVAEKVSPELVETGELISVKAGEKIPIDGVIVNGFTSIDTSSLTGESLPCDKTVGDSVISGAVNLSGEITVKTSCAYNDSTVARILSLVESSSAKKAKTEGFITRFARYYTPAVVIGAVLLATIPPIFFSGEWQNWLHRALIFLVVSCPCALVVSVPLSFFGGLGGASRNGILIKGSVVLETLAKTDTLVVDKTGTLTEGCFYIEDIYSPVIPEKELLSLASAAETHSNHPVARCIAASPTSHLAENVTELAGKGISATIGKKEYFFGNAALMEQLSVEYEASVPLTAVHIADRERYYGYISVSDRLKPDASQTIAKLRKSGINNTVMLTGDNRSVAEKIARAVHIDRFYASLLPEDKVKKVEELMESGKTVAFVGDGINDAPVLTIADAGIAMGALGSDAAIEAADIVITDDRLERIPQAISIARKTLGIVRQNIFFALGVKAAILILGALGIANMWIAVFGDVGVTVIAVLNAMRTLYQKNNCKEKTV